MDSAPSHGWESWMRALPQKFKAAKLTVFFALLLLTIYYLVSAVGASRIMAVDATATKSEVLKRIPIGTSIERAQPLMADNGFKCLAMKNQRYAEDGPVSGKQINHGPADILWCDSGDRMTWSIFISKRWQVVFEDQAGNVSHVGVSVGGTGP